jgi:hypothetical protein
MKHERNNLMKRSLEKWGRAPIILGVLEHPLFWGLEHPFSRRARALTIQRGTSTHCSKTNKQRASEQLQNGHERNKFMKCSLEKMRARTHYFWGLEHPSFWGLEHPFSRRAWALIIQRAIKWRTSEQLQNEHERNEFMKMLSWKNGCAHPLFLGARAPIILGARAPIFLEGHEHSPFREHSIREQMNEHIWI